MFQSHSLIFIDNKYVKKNDHKTFFLDSPRSSQNGEGHKVFHIKIIRGPRATNADHFCTIGELTNKKFYITRKSLVIQNDNLSSDSLININSPHLNRFNIQKVHRRKMFFIEAVPKNVI